MTKYCACGCGTILKGESSTWAPGHHKRGKGAYLSEGGVQPHELGTTGTSIFAGKFQADINADFNDRDVRLDRYEKMEKTDSACKALFSVITLPIRSVKWWVEPASDANEDKKIADSITWNLNEGMTHGWDQHLQECLTCVSRGFSVFEKVFETTDAEEFTGEIKWRKLAFRAQRTIDEWRLDKSGGLESVRQFFTEGDLRVDVEIPVEKLLVYTYQKEGSNYEGDALFRACWRDFYYKDALQRIEAIGLERFWIGIPTITLPKASSVSDKDAAYDVVTKLRGDEAAGVVLPPDWVLDILRVATEGGSMAETIQRYARNIFLTGLAHFLALGDKSTGSWALSKDQSTFFLFALNAIADSIVVDTLNKHAIPQLVKMNWPRVTKFPKLRHDDLDQIDLTSFSTNIKSFVEAGYLTAPDEDVEAQVREMLGLPEISEKTKEQQAQPKVDMTKQPKKQEEEPTKSLAEFENVVLDEDDVVMAVIDFMNRTPEGSILDAEVLTS